MDLYLKITDNTLTIRENRVSFTDLIINLKFHMVDTPLAMKLRVFAVENSHK